MNLSGKTAWFALGAAALAGVGVGAFAAGWGKARGVEPVTASADAGVSVQLDAGVASAQNFEFHLGDWKAIPIPPPAPPPRKKSDAVPAFCSCPTSYIYVPDVRLAVHQESQATMAETVTATAAAHADVPSASAATHWEIGPVYLRGVKDGSNLVGGLAGWNGGPFGIKALVVAGDGDVHAGAALVWRW